MDSAIDDLDNGIRFHLGGQKSLIVAFGIVFCVEQILNVEGQY
jgi:hypothetical protein